MVKTEFGLLEVQRKGLRWDAFELGQTEFGIGPEGLDSVDMAVTSGEFIFSMMDSKVLGVSDVHQALIASRAVTVDDAIDRDMTPNNLLQRGLSGIRDNLLIDPAIAFEDTEDNGFRSGTTSALTPNPPRTEVGFVHFDLPGKGAVERTLIDQPGSDSLVDRVDRSDAEAGQIGSLRGWKIKGEEAQNLPEFALRNLRPFVVPIFPIHIRSLAVN
jgi:hypothetical protein